MRTVPYGLSGLNTKGPVEWTLTPLNEEARSGTSDSGYNTLIPAVEETRSPIYSSTSWIGSLSTSSSSLGAALLRISLLVFTPLFYIIFLGFLLFVSVAFAILGLITCPIWAPPVLLWRRWLLNRGALVNGT